MLHNRFNTVKLRGFITASPGCLITNPVDSFELISEQSSERFSKKCPETH
jgi:hypothetical protein